MRWLFKTKAEIKADEQRRREKKIDQQIKRECRYYMDLIPRVLANSGIDHRLPRADRGSLLEEKVLGITNRQKVKIIEARYSQFAIYLWVDTRELPYRTVLPDLHSDAVLETLSDACDRQVAWRSVPGQGSWYVIWRNGAVNAIPAMFNYSEAVQMIPQNAGPLYFIAGVAENNTLIHGDLTKMPHYLVAGSTYTGKSVHLNNMLCQIIERNTPDRVLLLMMDLKGGSEFAFYDGLPHLWRPIVKTPDDVIPALEEYQAEMTRRQSLFTSEHVKNLDGYNDKHRDAKLPYIVMVFDEMSLILNNPDRKMAKGAEIRLANILALSRSAGMHSVICTQRPSAEVVKPYIKNNAPTRICFAVPSFTDSIVVIDRGDASLISPETPGRAIFSAGPSLIELQSPYISDGKIDQVVREAIERGGGVAPKRPDEIMIDDILDESINNFGGKLHTEKLYKVFAGRIARAHLDEMITRLMGQTVIFQGKRYQAIQKGMGRHGGRMLVPLDPAGDSAAFGEERGFRLVLPRLTPRPEHSILKPAPESDVRKVS
jgi:hypothetical protein